MESIRNLDEAISNGDAKIAGGVMQTEDGQTIPLSPEEAKAIVDAAAQEEEENKQFLQTLMKRLQDKCDEVVKAKRPIEQRWIDDIRQYDGAPRVRMSKQDTTSVNRATLEPPRVHATRVRTDLLEARLCDMIFPTNDHAWDMAPKLDDEWEAPQEDDPVTAQYGDIFSPQVPDAGQPPDPNDPNAGQPQQNPQAQSDDANEAACRKMKQVIQSQLAECQFVTRGRRMIRDACRYGTGILFGPVSTVKVQRRFRGQNMEMIVKEVPIPELQHGDPWCFFPDMVPHIEKAEFVFYLHLKSAREVQELATSPGFDKKEIIALLKEDPNLGELKVNLAYRNNNLERIEPTTNRYAVWRYTGSLDHKDLKALSSKFLDFKDDLESVDYDCSCDEDELQTIPMVDLWYCQGHILKARIRPIEKDFRVPYYVYSPFPADDTMFGYGIPYLCRDSQRVVDASWQIALHNSSVSAGPIIALRAGKIQPRDRSYEFRGPKVMDVTDPNMPIDDVMKIFNIDNTAAQALAIMDKALAILDDEAMTPQILQGDASQSIPTSSGAAMIMNNSGIMMRRGASCADDDIFMPCIQRMYWWNMMFNNRQDIKGDYDVVALTQNKYLVKDIQLQHLQLFMQQAMNAPLPILNQYEGFKLWANLLEIPEKVLNDKSVIDQFMASQQQQPPDPKAELVQAQSAKEMAMAKRMEADAQLKMTQTQMASQGGKIDPTTAQLEMADQQTRRMEANAQMQVAQLRAKADLAKEGIKHQGNLQTNTTKLNVANVKSTSDLQREGMRTRVMAEELAVKKAQGEGI